MHRSWNCFYFSQTISQTAQGSDYCGSGERQVRRCGDDNVEELNRFKWTAIIADEVHKIKVPKYYFDDKIGLLFYCFNRLKQEGSKIVKIAK